MILMQRPDPSPYIQGFLPGEIPLGTMSIVGNASRSSRIRRRKRGNQGFLPFAAMREYVITTSPLFLAEE